MICVSYLSNLEIEHLIRRATVSVSHLVCDLYTCNWHSIFHLTPSRWSAPLGQRIREWEVFGEQTKLSQHTALVPRNVLMIQSITTNIYHGRERYFDSLVGGRNPR